MIIGGVFKLSLGTFKHRFIVPIINNPLLRFCLVLFFLYDGVKVDRSREKVLHNNNMKKQRLKMDTPLL